MERTNFPLVSICCSFCPVSVSKKWTFPFCAPEIMCLPSGENATVQDSIGPLSILRILSPLCKSHRWIVESRELETAFVASLLISTATTPKEWSVNLFFNRNSPSETFQTRTISSTPEVIRTQIYQKNMTTKPKN